MPTKTTVGANMLLITSSFRNVKSFNLIPVTEDCPYVEAMFDPTSNILAVITKNMKQSFHMVPRLNDEGQPQRLKFPNKETGKTVKEQRVSVDTFSEFYITEKEEILQFLNLFAINAKDYDIEQYFAESGKDVKTSDLILGPNA